MRQIPPRRAARYDLCNVAGVRFTQARGEPVRGGRCVGQDAAGEVV